MKWLSFIATGWMPLLFGVYLAYREDYLIAAGCFVISFVGFRQVYDFLKIYETIEVKPRSKIIKLLIRQVKKQKRLIDRNTLISSAAIRELLKKSDKQQAELRKIEKLIEQKEKEIVRMRQYYERD